MIKAASLILLALALSACTPTAPGTANTSSQVASIDTASSETASSASDSASVTTIAVHAKTIPAAFLGSWDGVGAKCHDAEYQSDMALDISPTSLDFYESNGSVDAVTITSPSDITVQTDMSGEGEQWKRTQHMVLTDSGQTLTIDDGKGGVRKRCPAWR